MTNTITKITFDGEDYIVGGSDIAYVTQAEYEALLPGAESDGKHYFIYTSSTPPTPTGYTITGSTSVGSFSTPNFVDTQGCYISPDGEKMYVSFWNNWDGKLAQYTLSTPRDISTATQVTSIGVTQPDGIYFTEDGLYFFIFSESGSVLKRYSMSTAWDISTATQDQSVNIGWGFNIDFTNNGRCLVFGKTNLSGIVQYELSTPYDLTTATNQKNILSGGDYSAVLRNEGKYMYIMDNSQSVTQYELDTPYDITSNRTVIGTYSASGQSNRDIRGLYVSPDGQYWTMMYGSNNYTIQQLEAQPMS